MRSPTSYRQDRLNLEDACDVACYFSVQLVSLFPPLGNWNLSDLVVFLRPWPEKRVTDAFPASSDCCQR